MVEAHRRATGGAGTVGLSYNEDRSMGKEQPTLNEIIAVYDRAIMEIRLEGVRAAFQNAMTEAIFNPLSDVYTYTLDTLEDSPPLTTADLQKAIDKVKEADEWDLTRGSL